MARRYEDIKTEKTLYGKVGYLPTIYPSVSLSNEDFYIVAREQDRMDLLAADFYGNSSLWWVIAMANDLPGDSVFPPLGFQLRIPNNANRALDEFESLNTNR
tara:strand:+ start:283 stop:588 length:306 start_codon:yes stop_codon:yes gene_type:complete